MFEIIEENICCECHEEIKGRKKYKMWYGDLLPMCYRCWEEMMTNR